MFIRIFVVVLILGLGACASIVDSRPPEEIVAERAAIHLELLRTQQWEEALAYTTPGFRSNTDPDRYAARYGGVWMWQSTRIGDVVCEGDPEIERCTVQSYRTVLMAPKVDWPTEHYKPQIWIKVDGSWYIYQR